MTEQEQPKEIAEADVDEAIATCDGDPPRGRCWWPASY